MARERLIRTQFLVIVVLTTALFLTAGWHRYETGLLKSKLLQQQKQFLSAISESAKDNAHLQRENEQLQAQALCAEFDRKFAQELNAHVDFDEQTYRKVEGILPGRKQ